MATTSRAERPEVVSTVAPAKTLNVRPFAYCPISSLFAERRQTKNSVTGKSAPLVRRGLARVPSPGPGTGAGGAQATGRPFTRDFARPLGASPGG